VELPPPPPESPVTIWEPMAHRRRPNVVWYYTSRMVALAIGLVVGVVVLIGGLLLIAWALAKYVAP
jgi:hypothetical protein